MASTVVLVWLADLILYTAKVSSAVTHKVTWPNVVAVLAHVSLAPPCYCGNPKCIRCVGSRLCCCFFFLCWNRLKKYVVRQICLPVFGLMVVISLRLLPFSFLSFSVTPADRCAIPSLSGVYWRLMCSIGMECLHGWLLIGAEAMEAWRPFSSQTQNYCA